MNANQHRYPQHLALHTWAGILFGLLIFVLMFSGSVAVFHHELEQWQEPISEQSHLRADPNFTIDTAFRETLHKIDGEVEEISLALPRPNHPLLEIHAHVHAEDDAHEDIHFHYAIDASGNLNSIDEPRPGVAGFLTEFHTHMHLPHVIAPWILGPAALMMLVLLVTGMLMHRNHFGKLFTFRPSGSKRIALLDFHTLLGVWALPFYAIIALTAIPMGFHFGPWLSWMAVGPAEGDTNAFNYVQWFQEKWPEATGETVRTQNLDTVLEKVKERDSAFQPAEVVVIHPDDANARIVFAGFSQRSVSRTPVKVFSGSTGEFMRLQPSNFTSDGSFAGNKLFALMFSLHFGDFGGFASRTLWFVLGLSGAFLAVSGQYLWIAKRRNKAEHPQALRNIHAMEKMTVGVCSGLALATLTSLALWPLCRKWAPDFEEFGLSGWLFGSVWLLSLVYTAVRKDTNRSHYHLLTATGVSALAAPLIRGLLWGDHCFAAWLDGRFATFAIDVLLIICGLFVFIGLGVRKMSSRNKTVVETANPAPVVKQAAKEVVSIH